MSSSAASVSIAAEWQLLYNRYYRKPEIYSLQWSRYSIDLRRHRVACAPLGGPIAAIRDDSKIVQLYAESARRKLQIFTSSGVLLSSVIWDRPGGRLVGMSWTDDHILVCVVQDGTVYRYDSHAKPLKEFSLGPECLEQGVAECTFWGNGLVAITEGNILLCVPDFGDPKPVKLADPVLEEPPLCLAVIEPQFTMSGNVEVLVGSGDGVLVVEEDGVQRLGEGVGPLQKLSVSQNGKLLASFTHDGRLLVIPTDFSRIIFEYSCESSLPPEQLAWCGTDSVVLYWDEMLLMVGPLGDPVHYAYDEPITLIPECDGVRILSNTSMEFLQRVKDSTVSIFQIGSTQPAALLYDALDHFDKRSAKADENLRLIRSSLPEAVQTCIDAAGHEFDISRQHTLLRAASYGQAFCSQIHRDRFQEMCKTLRVLNAVRDPAIGIPLSIEQYKLLTAPVLVARLINAHQHLLALRISEYLNTSTELVVMHWACAKITASAAMSDAELLEILIEKLNCCKGISFAAVATHADNNGRRKLAALLVEHEPRFSKQVPLLLSIEEDDRALVKATESGDTDLVYLVLFHIWKKYSTLLRQRVPREFFEMIHAKLLARDLFVTYARCYDHESLKDFFLSNGQFQVTLYLTTPEASHKLRKQPNNFEPPSSFMNTSFNPLMFTNSDILDRLTGQNNFIYHHKFLQDLAFLLLKESWELGNNPMASKGSPLHGPRIKLIEKARDLFSETREHVFESKAADEHAKLLRVQHELEVSTKQAIFVDSSISDTIRTCIALGNNRAAMKVRMEFKVSEKRWYWLKVFALATIRDWDGLEKFSKEKKPPTGYKPFVEACIEFGEKAEALKYIPKLTDPREKAEAYEQIGMAKEAADAASESKDGELLGRLKSTFAQNAASISIFDTLRDRLSFQGVS